MTTCLDDTSCHETKAVKRHHDILSYIGAMVIRDLWRWAHHLSLVLIQNTYSNPYVTVTLIMLSILGYGKIPES